MKCIMLILVVGIVGCALGIWTGDSKAMDAEGNTIPGGYKPLVEWYRIRSRQLNKLEIFGKCGCSQVSVISKGRDFRSLHYTKMVAV